MLPTPSPFVCARLWWSDPYKVLWEAHHANHAFLQQAEFSGFQGRLRPVAHPQLAQDVAEVVLDGTTWSSCPPLVERRSSTLVACACLRIFVSASCPQR